MRVIETGRPSRTHYRRLASWAGPGVTLLSVRLESGRTHQIRVHCRAIGHPVVGDPVYGPGRPVRGDPGRTWLHAERLSFDHPETGERLTIVSDLPADLHESIALLGPPDRGSVPLSPTPDDATTVD
jgi:23S rRNA pseudouridine1911/1915/1917 synthase